MGGESPVSETARRDLVRHIQRFVAILERNRRQPNRREAYHVLVALECLEAGDCERGEQEMRDAEHLVALPTPVAGLQGIHEKMTTQQLSGRLADIVGRDQQDPIALEQFPRDVLAQWAAQHPEIVALYVFGSRARGTARPDAALELAVELDGSRESEPTILVVNRVHWQTVLSELTDCKVSDIYLVSDKQVSGTVIEVFRRTRR